ncbi:MAG: hypothetical protein HQK49_01145 [Oligoflexia bacterium]|nr:hypothetical protein [Oligoflexia bacterium]
MTKDFIRLKKIKKLLSPQSNAEIKFVFYYFSSSLLFILTFFIVISIAISFHFLLDHQIGEIKEWLYKNEWNILSVSKIISFAIAIMLLNNISSIRINTKTFKHFITKLFSLSSVKVMLPISYLLLILFCANYFFWNIQITSIISSLEECSSILLLYLLEFLLISYLKEKCSLQFFTTKKISFFIPITLSIIFCLTTASIFPYKKLIMFLIMLINFMTILFIFYNIKRSTGFFSSLYILIITIPSILLANNNSYLYTNRTILHHTLNDLEFFLEYTIVWIFGLLYILYKQTQKNKIKNKFKNKIKNKIKIRSYSKWEPN